MPVNWKDPHKTGKREIGGKMMKHKREPWVEDMFGAQPSSNFKQVSKEDFERAMICVNACAGITTEALENGLVKFLLDEKHISRLNPFLPVPQTKKGMTYLGKPIYEEDYEEDKGCL